VRNSNWYLFFVLITLFVVLAGCGYSSEQEELLRQYGGGGGSSSSGGGGWVLIQVLVGGVVSVVMGVLPLAIFVLAWIVYHVIRLWPGESRTEKLVARTVQIAIVLVAGAVFTGLGILAVLGSLAVSPAAALIWLPMTATGALVLLSPFGMLLTKIIRWYRARRAARGDDHPSDD